ncbi:hypothetical protein L873DRAFT_1076799 [Choiromyces venosus 120613-1]|uniref:Uncharacterized protein n=1 Tax=Choiromyces venosus 120613-1 TaxID=1336337 RepID=A0A3N4JNA9_9PEZI|nr:hypothetical protein L873DRAFT_1076799 [Choiromyces venosus 120613-1]
MMSYWSLVTARAISAVCSNGHSGLSGEYPQATGTMLVKHSGHWSFRIALIMNSTALADSLPLSSFWYRPRWQYS